MAGQIFACSRVDLVAARDQFDAAFADRDWKRMHDLIAELRSN